MPPFHSQRRIHSGSYIRRLHHATPWTGTAHPARVEGALSSRPLAYLQSTGGNDVLRLTALASGIPAVGPGGMEAAAHAALIWQRLHAVWSKAGSMRALTQSRRA